MKNTSILGFAIVLAFLTSCTSSPPPQAKAPQEAESSPPSEGAAATTASRTAPAIGGGVEKEEPQETPPTKITSPDDVKRIIAQIADLITPFTIAGIRNGLKNEQDLWNQSKGGFVTSGNQQKGDFVVNTGGGTIETLTMTKARQAGGKVSVEVGLRNGNIEMIQFKLLPDNAGFQDIWNAQPVVVLSKRISTNASDGLGFERVEIREGNAMKQYELP